MLPELADIKSTGGALSERFPISFNENGKKVEGFFTKPVVTSINAAVGTVIDQASEKYPKYKTVWNKMKDHLQTNCGSEALVNIQIEATTLTPDSLGLNDPSLNNNNDFDQAFHEVRSGLIRRIQNLGHYYDIGADQNERTDLRNVTMSEVADALGKPELLARSRNVQVLSGGEIMEGVFMEKAKGEDIRYIEPDRGLGRLTEDNSEAAFNNAQGLKSLADLQVIDYICNNTDRHSGNIFYQFDNSDPQKPKLIGVQGIDNDMSFGLGKQNPDRTNVTVMTEEMSEKIRDGKYIEEIENRMQNMYYKAHIKDMDAARNKLQVSLTKANELAQKETDKNVLLKYAAQEIYYKSVQKSDFYTVKNNEQLIKALSPLNRRDGVKFIMNDPAFKTIADKSDAEVKAMCAEPDKLYHALILSKAKDKEFKNKFREKQIKEDIAEKQKGNNPNRQNEGPKLNHN